MTRTRNKLNVTAVKNAKKAGRYSDGGGLYLHVGKSGNQSWVFVWKRNKVKREMGLGSALDVSLKQAREKAARCRKSLDEDKDPIVERDKSNEPIFLECALQYIADHEKRWKNEKHIYQWKHTLTVYAKPLHHMRVSQITTPDVLKVLKPIWLEKHETALRLRSRIEAVLDYATAMHWREGINPAIWRGNLKSLLPTISKAKRVVHHKAMDMDAMPTFMRELRAREAMAARLVEFVILTACRSIEAREARWSEVDLEKGVWTIPKERMKGGREHIVPLSKRVIEILTPLHELHQGDFIFVHSDKLTTFSVNAPRALLKRMGKDETLHGFRATFKSWATDKTNFQREVIEMSLAHKIGSEVEASYLRTSAIEKRRELMERWSDYCGGYNRAKVVRFYAN
ncbi:MAG: tyrosine-type recombinase/integrase [Maricaulaceae bacterium]